MTRTLRFVALLLLACPAAALAQTAQPSTPIEAYDRFDEFIHNTVESPAFHIEAFGAALIDQVDHFPKDWDDGDHAFLKRNAARFGQAFVAGVIEASAAEAMDYHVGYERCGCSGGFKRLGHVVVHTFVVRHVDGHIVLNTPFLVSRYASSALAKVWYPDSYTASDVVVQGTASLGTAVGLNLLDEFGPDLLHVLHLK